MEEKKTEAMSVKLPEPMKVYCKSMAELHGLTPSGYMRKLLAEDMKRTAHDLNLRAEALGAKVIHGIVDFEKVDSADHD